jgi:blue copper oxidase
MNMKRRQFLQLSAMGGALLSARKSSYSKPRDRGLDPREPQGFSNPLHTPGQDGILGVFEPQAPFTIRATSATTTILPGRKSGILAYEVNAGRRGFINPILRVRKGARLTARLSNGLAQNTIIHWHGLIVDETNDGIPTQAIAPGAVYQYDFAVRNRAGAYWYHPHPFELTSEQAYRGLASYFLVEDEDELRLRQALDLQLGENDIPLVIQDKRFDETGNLMYEPTADEWFMGFLGDTILVNFTVKPVLDVAPRIYRFRLLNGSNARIYRLAFIRGAAQTPFYVIGTDGGFLPQPAPATEIFLAPGERADVLLDLGGARHGEELFLKSLPFDPMDNEEMRGACTPAQPPMALANGEEFYVLKLDVVHGTMRQARIPRVLSTITPINVSGAYTRPIILSAGPEPEMTMQWFINGSRYNPAQVPIQVRRNSVEIWEIINEMDSMPHPMHIHGFQFQVLQRLNSPAQVAVLAGANGLLPTDTGWKDTVLTWPGEIVRIALDFTHPFPGEQNYVFHCHNLEHEDMGMMINYRVT